MRRSWRLFRSGASRAVQVLCATVLVVLIADILALAATSSSSTTTGLSSDVAAGHATSHSGHGKHSGTTSTNAFGGIGTGVTNGTGTGTNSGGASDTGTGGGSGSTGIGGTGTNGGGTSGAGGPSATTGTGSSTSTSSPTGPLQALGHGVTASTVKVVFPWPNLGALGSVIGLYGSSEDDTLSINAAVDAINNAGGINGRQIAPEIVGFNPLDDTSMRADCLQWTQDQHVFAVVDAESWHDDEQLCITQENHTPLISMWTTVNQWTQEGSPNLWWTGPSVNDILSNLVAWGVGAHYLSPTTPVGVVAADREGDTLSTQALDGDLGSVGIKPAVQGSMHYDLADSAQAILQATDIVSQLEAKHVETIIPLLPYTDFLYFVEAAQQQGYFPRWLLSDYEYEDEAALGLIDPSSSGPYAKELNNAINPTFYDLGNCDCGKALPIGYDPFGSRCNANFYQYSGAAWRKEDEQENGNNWSGNIETTGTAMTWCTNIDIFATAARAVPPNQLTQANFDAAMANISGFQGQLSPSYSFSATRHAGPDEYRVVEEHVNSDNKCPLKVTGATQGDCWLILQDFQPEATTP
jgi:hypothetical protein